MTVIERLKQLGLNVELLPEQLRLIEGDFAADVIYRPYLVGNSSETYLTSGVVQMYFADRVETLR